MGLDMYLEIKKSLYKSAFRDNLCSGDVPKEICSIIPTGETIEYVSKDTCYGVGYWRKANAIHKFFVNKCACGEDDCKPAYVSYETLEELHKDCVMVLEDHKLASKILPSEEGFFFGSQEYDDYYFEQLAYTKELTENVLRFLDKLHEQTKGEFTYEVIYTASW